MIWSLRGFLLLTLSLSFVWATDEASAKTGPAIALHYGHNAPLEDLKVFDIVVVEPDHGYDPVAQRAKGSELYAYTSVAEVQPSRSYFKDIPADWHLARNGHWNSVVLDQTPTPWPSFFADRVIAPLWQRGYRGFFLDTMDSYRLASHFDEAAQQAGLVRVIQTLHERFPGIRLIMNRGFDIVPRVKNKIEMVAAESLYRSWNAGANRYEEVPDADRQWLLTQLRTIQTRDGIPVLAIDYVPPNDRALARETAKRIQADGFTPWVSDSRLDTVGIGALELVPRRILILYNGAEAPAVNYTSAHRFLQMPLNHMGYVVDYADVRKPLPKDIYRDRYAGVVTAFNGYMPSALRREFSTWLQTLKNQGMPLAIVGDFGLAPDKSWTDTFGIQGTSLSISPPLQAQKQHPMMGLEVPPPPVEKDSAPARLLGPQAARAIPLVEMKDQKGQLFVAAALMPWGGFVLDPYVYNELPGTEQTRWVVDPFEFLQKALRLPFMPVPDITTENGRRLLLAHIDGDGFPSRAEMPGAPVAAQVLLKEILEKYRIPQTVSVIEGEVAHHGLHPELSGQLEDIARKMFKLPHVEIASHSFSHPYLWDTDVKHGIFSDSNEVEYHLNIPNYQVDLTRETAGSADYIRQNLAPAGKPVSVFQWTGDTAPNEAALKATYDAGLLNINGGDTFISRGNPSLTAVRPHGITKGNYLQVYAPIANENIFTNLWRGPFYGYERVLETFEMTDTPRRIKPVGIYYHTYSASKVAGLQALRKVYNWALNQPLHPVFTSEFIRKVQDFHTYAIAIEGEGWRVRGAGHLRTLRFPIAAAAMVAPLSTSEGVAGVSEGVEGSYVHLTGAQAWVANPASALVPSGPTAEARIWLHDANARITQWERKQQGLRTDFSLQGHVPLQFTLSGMAPTCKVSANGQTLAAAKSSEKERPDLRTYRLPDAAAQIQILCAGR
ncbi:bifunctional glycoside hydrolase 114/ polysaccharide deacetylase family protein [Acidovorax sp. 106]|uniref:bifunctional glycoside hydrolase 114/ polysaccharide deacetylase family protein n=1 Tax=Acidovorax sp. 106 TaxID=2135637 RepID=UPI000EB442E0|nr:bifunctional glycoside hydrolase 114/ polysaccharide deacetylase family protein [Acidovorax sp. 106]RLJ38706.1 hypothetical protein C8C98_2437 [Acidovorax sp. 106]